MCSVVNTHDERQVIAWGQDPHHLSMAQEMRRPAPDMPHSKRQRQDAKEDYAELGRFDYRAAEQLAQGAQGFIVTCSYQRCSVKSPVDPGDVHA